MKELLTMTDYYDATMNSEGYIVIQDAVRKPHRAHPPHCPSLQAEYFKEKVVNNKGKAGRYFWVATMSEAREQLGAVPCACGW